MADRARFRAALERRLNLKLTTANVVGIELILDEAERRRTPLGNLSYTFATSWWESGRTLQPVKEAFWKSEDWRRRNLRYYPFYGRGLVQLTWEANYRKASELVGENLVANPDRALDPAISVKVLFDGLERGWFTGKDLGDFIDNIDEADKEDLREYANARRVVNGTDRQVEIGKLALIFEAALKEAGYDPGSRAVVLEPAKPARSDGIAAGTAAGSVAAAGTAVAAAGEGMPGVAIFLGILAAVAGLAAFIMWKRRKSDDDDDKAERRSRGNKRA